MMENANMARDVNFRVITWCISGKLRSGKVAYARWEFG